MDVVPIPQLQDNYAYLIIDRGSGEAAIVDCAEAAPVLEEVRKQGVRLTSVLATHHHYDHVGGNEGLLEKFGKMPVFAHVSDVGRVPAQTERVEEGKDVSVAGLVFRPLHVPGHTLGAVSYFGQGAVFTGDTLFVAGCGRLFEGSPAQMHESLSGKLGKLPPETRVYCGHEYTVSNLRFAATVEPESAAIREKLEAAQAARGRGEPTIPSTIGDELAVNPFMRCGEASVRARFPGETPVEVLAAVRKAKDSFR